MKSTSGYVRVLAMGLAMGFAGGLAGAAFAKDPAPKTSPAVSEDEGEDRDDGTVNPVEPELAITENGKKVKHSCKGDAPLVVNVIGNNNTVTVDGECKKLIVTGNGNKVTLEAVGEINAYGDSITIGYKRGLGGKNPKINVVGEKVSVAQLKK